MQWVQEQDVMDTDTITDFRQGPKRGSHSGGAWVAAGEAVVGRRLTMFWPAEGAWFQGSVLRFHASGQHIIEWDDGEISVHDLGSESYRWLSEKEGDDAVVGSAAACKEDALLAERLTPLMDRRGSMLGQRNGSICLGRLQSCHESGEEEDSSMPPGLEEL